MSTENCKKNKKNKPNYLVHSDFSRFPKSQNAPNWKQTSTHPNQDSIPANLNFKYCDCIMYSAVASITFDCHISQRESQLKNKKNK